MSAVIPTLVTGVKGRMGAALVRTVRDDGGLQLVAGTDRKGSPSIGLDAGLVLGLGALEAPVLSDFAAALEERRPRVVIDFTNAEASVAHARLCAAQGVALVVGSTGFSPSDKEQVAACARQVPIVMSPNMSVGVNLVIKMAGQLAAVLGEDFDVEILETHHRMKKDAPSGTALRLADELAKVLHRTAADVRSHREGQVGERPKREIGVQALRGGDVVGEHTVYFLGEGERVELTHRATHREQFARGAVRAAKWVVQRPPGLYDMEDVLGLR